MILCSLSWGCNWVDEGGSKPDQIPTRQTIAATPFRQHGFLLIGGPLPPVARAPANGRKLPKKLVTGPSLP
jgi:hypothetical protein